MSASPGDGGGDDDDSEVGGRDCAASGKGGVTIGGFVSRLGVETSISHPFPTGVAPKVDMYGKISTAPPSENASSGGSLGSFLPKIPSNFKFLLDCVPSRAANSFGTCVGKMVALKCWSMYLSFPAALLLLLLMLVVVAEEEEGSRYKRNRVSGLARWIIG